MLESYLSFKFGVIFLNGFEKTRFVDDREGQKTHACDTTVALLTQTSTANIRPMDLETTIEIINEMHHHTNLEKNASHNFKSPNFKSV